MRTRGQTAHHKSGGVLLRPMVDICSGVDNPFGIQWQRYDDDAPYPDLVKTVPHVAFEVDDLQAALVGQNVIIQPNSPIKGLVVAFIEVNGAPIELMEIDRKIYEEDI